jgi:hypothetical protein
MAAEEEDNSSFICRKIYFYQIATIALFAQPMGSSFDAPMGSSDVPMGSSNESEFEIANGSWEMGMQMGMKRQGLWLTITIVFGIGLLLLGHWKMIRWQLSLSWAFCLQICKNIDSTVLAWCQDKIPPGMVKFLISLCLAINLYCSFMVFSLKRETNGKIEEMGTKFEEMGIKIEEILDILKHKQ